MSRGDANDSVYRKFLWLLLNVVLVVAVVVIFLVLYSGAEALERVRLITVVQLVALSIGQLVCLALAVVVWSYTLKSVADVDVKFGAAFVHVAFMLCAKYIPGKVWGMIARGALIEKAGVGIDKVVGCTVVEQALILFSGGVVGVVFTLCGLVGWYWLFLLLFVHVYLADFFKLFLRVLSFLADVLPKRVSILQALKGFALPKERLTKLYYLYVLQWVSVGGVLCILAEGLGHELDLSLALLLVGGLATAVIFGFAALFVPGGIGVREGVLVMMLSPVLGFEAGLMLGACHRVWLTLYDFLVGCFGVLLTLKKN